MPPTIWRCSSMRRMPGDSIVQAGAKQKAIELADKDQLDEVKKQLKQVEQEVGRERRRSRSRFRSSSRSRQAGAGGGAPGNPFGGPALRPTDAVRQQSLPGVDRLIGSLPCRREVSTVHGPLAQLAEQGTLNPKVEGSIPSWPIWRREDDFGLRRSAAHVREHASPPASLPKPPSHRQMRRGAMTA